MPTTRELAALVWQRLAQVPVGRVTTFGAIAASLGAATAARWVGTVVGRYPPPPNCPVHRLVRADGSLAGVDQQAMARRCELLRHEGVAGAESRVDLARYGWREFQGPRPLEPLVAWQAAARDRVTLRTWRRLPRWVAGIDASYATTRGGPSRGEDHSEDLGDDHRQEHGVAAYVLYDLRREQLVWSTTVAQRVSFPYLPGLLGWRELPLFAAVVAEAERADRLAELLLVDGSGILHPRGCGLATHLGLITGMPTVGAAKKLLCGELGPLRSAGWQPITVGDELRGAAWPVGPGQRKIFVSPGTGIDVSTAARVVGWARPTGKSPAPIARADQLSRAEARRLGGGAGNSTGAAPAVAHQQVRPQ